MNFCKTHPILSLYSGAGVLLGIGFIFPLLWPLGLLGVALYAYALTETSTLKKVLLGSYLTWTMKAACAVVWFWSTYPIDWIDVSLGTAELPVIGVYWFTVSLFLGVGGVFFGVMYWYAKRFVSKALLGIVFALGWMMAEVIGSFGFSVGTYGAGGSLNSYFSFGYIGYLLANHPLLLPLAGIAGAYGLTFLAALFGYYLYFSHARVSRERLTKYVVLAVVILSLSTILPTPREAERETAGETTVAVVNTRFGGDFFKRVDKDEYKQSQVGQAVDKALALNPDYILLPEDSRFILSENEPPLAYRLFRFNTKDSDVIMVDTARTPLPNGRNTQRAVVYDGVNKKGFAVDKQYLVPQGEFMPYFYAVSLRLLGQEKVAQALGDRLSYRPGPFGSQAELPAEVPGILFCFEAADPRGVRRLLTERTVPFVAHPISHAWFHESEILWHHFDLMLKVQAVWNDTYIVSAGNMVEGALYTPEGKKVRTPIVATGEAFEVRVFSF